MKPIDVVRFEGPPSVLAWKFPNDALSTFSQLIVNESQEAVLFKGGQALDVFASGHYVLETANIPLLNKLVNLPFGGKTPFTAEVWFVNRLHALDIKWGTPTPIQLQDPQYGIIVPVRSYGQFGVRVVNSKQFLMKLVGTMPHFTQEALVKYFRGLYLTKVKDALSSYIVNKKVGILEINAYIDELSAHMKARIAPVLDEYGIELVNFYVNEIGYPEDDPGFLKLKEALAKRAEMNIVGYDYTSERSFDTMEGMAKNTGTPLTGLLGAGIGLGLGRGAGGNFAEGFAEAGAKVNVKGKAACPGCGEKVPRDGSFCPKCGEKLEREEGVACTSCGAVLPKGVKFCPECGDRYDPCPECGYDMKEEDAACPKCGYAKPVPCPGCGAVHKKSSKFCPECGASMVKRCPGCDEVINGSPKFCPECGQQL